jgi:NADP-dependent 3-hydroxy acid dehydrogenase YdfG
LDTYQIQIQVLCFDVRNAKEVNENLSQIDSNKFPIIDILINNAGLAAGFGSIDAGEIEDWDVMLDTNVKGLLYVSREIIPIFKQQGYGHIINISSTAGKDVYANGNVYCASKHAVDALSKSMRIDLLNFGIKVTSINPGACETEFSLVRFKGDEERAKQVYEGFTPLQADDIADAIFYTANLPKHVCVNDLTITCLTQANANYNIKKIV